MPVDQNGKPIPPAGWELNRKYKCGCPIPGYSEKWKEEQTCPACLAAEGMKRQGTA